MKTQIFTALLALGVLGSFAADKFPGMAELRFVPEGGPWRGEKVFEGASWIPLMKANPPFMQAGVGIGEKFPVQDKEKGTLFEVVLIDGNSEHLELEVRSTGGVQKVDVAKNKTVEVDVAGVKYGIYFPGRLVKAAPNELPSTNRAMVMVMVTRKAADKQGKN